MIKKIKNTLPWAYVIRNIIFKKILERFTKENCKKQIKKSLEFKK